jgi:hypothetical protein
MFFALFSLVLTAFHAEAAPIDCPNHLCIGAVKMDCSSQGDRLFERQKKGEDIIIYFQIMNHGPVEPMSREHVANLMDSDYEFLYELATNVQQPEYDITTLNRVAPLGDELLHEFVTLEIDGSPKMVATSIFGLSDRAVSKSREGSYELERFSRIIGGEVRSFNVLMLTLKGTVNGEDALVDPFLRGMRAKVNLTDAQLYKYGVQFALRDDRKCRTLSYAQDPVGRIGLVYSDGFGNFLGDALNKSRVTAYGESVQRNIWHRMRGKVNGDLKFEIRSDSDSDRIGLVSVLEEDMAMISRTVSFDLVLDTFEKLGTTNLTFGKVARECTSKVGLNNYDEFQKRGIDHYPTYYTELIGCVESSNFKKKDTSFLSPIRTRLTLHNSNGESRDFYVRKFRSIVDNTFDRYRVADLFESTSQCVVTGVGEFDNVVDCLNKKRYQVVAFDKIKPRAMLHLEIKAPVADTTLNDAHEIPVQSKSLEAVNQKNNKHNAN